MKNLSKEEFEKGLANDLMVLNSIGNPYLVKETEIPHGDERLEFFNEFEKSEGIGYIKFLLQRKDSPCCIRMTLKKVYDRDNEFKYYELMSKEVEFPVVLTSRMRPIEIFRGLYKVVFYENLKYEISDLNDEGVYKITFENGFCYEIWPPYKGYSEWLVVNEFADDVVYGHNYIAGFDTKEEAFAFVPELLTPFIETFREACERLAG